MNSIIGLCPFCKAQLQIDDWCDPGLDGVTLWEHPSGHECEWCSTTLSPENWHQLADLAADAILVKKLRIDREKKIREIVSLRLDKRELKANALLGIDAGRFLEKAGVE